MTAHGRGFLWNIALAVSMAASAASCAVDAAKPADGAVRRREIAVSLIGQGRPSFPLEEASVAKVVRYLTKGMDREIAKKPDLVVLPERCDMLVNLRGADKAKWIRMRGTKIREAMQEYAAKHRCYVVYAADRELEDGRFANSCTLIDRNGGIAAVYDKCFPMTTEMDSPGFPIVPGREAVVADTDFGRVGFAICFDLNFPELRRQYAAKKPDIIVFSSAFDGGYLQQEWARECQAYVVSATVGAAVPGRIIDPAGGEQRRESYYFPIFTEYVNTNFRVIHLDFNGEKFPSIIDKYGRRVTIRNPGTVGTVTLFSNDPSLPVDDVMKEFSLEPLDLYLDRARRVRGEYLPPDAKRAADSVGVLDVVLENARFRLVLSGDGYAKSLVLKATGEEMLEEGVRLPFSTITQNRAYDNEFKLMYAAKPWTIPSVKIAREGDELRIGYRDEFFTAVVKIETTDSYIGLKLLRFDYELEASGFKRKTEVDSFALAQLPVKRRARFGRTLNVMWDEKGCLALMAAVPETRIDAFDRESGGATFFAGGEKSVGIEGVHAVLVAADAPGDFLDCVDAMERGYGLPLGVRSRRHPLCAASYLAMLHVTPENVGEFISIAKEGGFRTALQFGDFDMWRTIGQFLTTDAFAGGMDDYRKVSDAVRAAGLVPGLHFFCTKVSRTDPYLAGGHPDPRMNTVCEVILDRPAGAEDKDLFVQTRPALLRREKGRGLVQFGDELVMYGGFTEEPPYMLTNCVRGLWNSKAAAHPRNTVGRHLDVDDWTLFIRCGDNGIIDEIADRLAAWIKAGGARFFYMDGAEDVPEPFWYHVPRVQWNLWKKIATPPLWSETALKSHFGWHMHSRGNAFDVFKGELQRGSMRKYILRTARQDADDFSPVNLGWMNLQPPVRPDPKKKMPSNAQFAQTAFWNGTTGVQPDTVEYVACKAAAWNSPIGFQVRLESVRKHPRAADCLAAFKRWEDAKLDGRFSAAQREMFKDADREWFLWPFASPDKPEPVEWHQVTKDSEWPANPVRAFSYTRGGKAGIVCWRIDAAGTPEVALSGLATTSRRDGGRLFIEADVAEEALTAAFRRYLQDRRPYEFKAARRDKDDTEPLFGFEEAAAWKVGTVDADAACQITQTEQLFGSNTLRLSYCGTGRNPKVTVSPPVPASLPKGFNSFYVWVKGNHWGTGANTDFSIPSPALAAVFRRRDGSEDKVALGKILWPDWNQVNKRFTAAEQERLEGGAFVGFELTGGTQKERLDLHFDNVAVFREDLDGKLAVKPRARRNLRPLAGADEGINTGSGVLPFPTREDTIIPVTSAPAEGDLKASFNGGAVAGADTGRLKTVVSRKGKSLVVDFHAPAGAVTEVSAGVACEAKVLKSFTVPYLAYGRGENRLKIDLLEGGWYRSAVFDWYRSNASAPRMKNGAFTMCYLPRTDGTYATVSERLVVTVSRDFAEVLPEIPNPVSPYRSVTGRNAWRAHGSIDHESDKAFWREIKKRGIVHVVVNDHETMWRDGGESFTFRDSAAPGKGGDEGAAEYSRYMRNELGFVYGPYNNYTDFSPMNARWSRDLVVRLGDGSMRTAWVRCYAPKPVFAPQLCEEIVPKAQSKFRFNTAYCDVHTAVAPFERTDFDARVPGAGTFAQTFYAWGELLMLQKRLWEGPVYSEGGFHFLYSGLTDGNYAQDRGYDFLTQPWIVDFDLLRIHPKECNFGMGTLSMFSPGKTPEERRFYMPHAPTEKDRDELLDLFLTATVAFGHAPYLVLDYCFSPPKPFGLAYGPKGKIDIEKGMPMAMKSYAMVQPIAARYTQAEAKRIAYLDSRGRAVGTSQAIADGTVCRRQVLVEYSDGTVVVANGNVKERLKTVVDGKECDLPPRAFKAWTKDGSVRVEIGEDADGRRTYTSECPEFRWRM